MSRGEDFLSRWSRRKRSGPEPEDEAPPAPELAQPAEPEPAPEVEDEDEAATLERLGLPDPDTLEQGADFSVFMQSAVPEAIRKRALRRLWRSNPTLAVLDGLNDYDDDFSGGFVPPGTLKTAYEVGRGIVNRALEEDAEADEATALAEADEAARPAPQSSSLRAPVESRPPAPEPEPADEIAAEEALPEGEVEEEDTPRPTRRRMAFRFEDSG